MRLWKMLVLALLVGSIAVPVQAADNVCERAIGVRIMPYGALLRSVDFLYSPSFGIGGVLEENSGRTTVFRGSSLATKTQEITAVVGYWSNADRKSWLGFHVYLGMGVSFVEVESREYTAVSPAISHDKFGLGLDFYLGRHFALTADVMGVSRPPIPLKGEMVMAIPRSKPMVIPMVYQLTSETREAVFQVGCRVWF